MESDGVEEWRSFCRWEEEQAAIEAGRVVTRLLRLFSARLGPRPGEPRRGADAREGTEPAPVLR